MYVHARAHTHTDAVAFASRNTQRHRCTQSHVHTDTEVGRHTQTQTHADCLTDRHTDFPPSLPLANTMVLGALEKVLPH